MAKARLQLYGFTGKYASVETDATKGATVGTDLHWPDGSVVQASQIRNTTSSGGNSGSSIGTTDDLDEGSHNLYFTSQRSQDAVGGILTDSDTIHFTYSSTSHFIRADLKSLTNAGGGVLVKVARDIYGRVSGTSAASTDDLAEGSANLYFTKFRVAAALAQGSGINLTTDPGTGVTTISWVPVTQGNDLADWATIDLIDWSNVQLTDWAASADTVSSFKGRTGDVLPQAGDYTTSIVAEGSNLYFTAARVLGVVLAGLSTATNGVITASDTILQALGKLQAQISARQVIGDPIPFPVFPLAGLPSVSANQYKAIYVTGLTGGDEPCYSDGTNWRRFSDRSIAN